MHESYELIIILIKPFNLCSDGVSNFFSVFCLGQSTIESILPSANNHTKDFVLSSHKSKSHKHKHCKYLGLYLMWLVNISNVNLFDIRLNDFLFPFGFPFTLSSVFLWVLVLRLSKFLSSIAYWKKYILSNTKVNPLISIINIPRLTLVYTRESEYKILMKFIIVLFSDPECLTGFALEWVGCACIAMYIFPQIWVVQ